MPPVITPKWIVPDTVTLPVREGEGIRSAIAVFLAGGNADPGLN